MEALMFLPIVRRRRDPAHPRHRRRWRLDHRNHRKRLPNLKPPDQLAIRLADRPDCRCVSLQDPVRAGGSRHRQICVVRFRCLRETRPMTDSDEKQALHRYLRSAREVLLWKLDGLSDYDIRRPMTLTGTNLLGLVK